MQKWLSIFWLKVLIHLGAVIPVVYYYQLAINDQLGADPVKSIIHFTGIGALNLMLITLAISPIAKKAKWGALINVRRLVGLYCFTYAILHLLSFILFELQNDFALLISEIIKRPYITVGMAAWLLLFSLTVTSPISVRKKMGRTWQKLHNWVYAAATLIVVHFYWSVKSDITEPLIYICILLILLSLRRKKLTRFFNSKKSV